MTLAYSDQDASAAPVVEAVRSVPSPIDVVIRQVSLVSQEQVGRLYRWDRVADISPRDSLIWRAPEGVTVPFFHSAASSTVPL
jgi:hypothetical protein